ncbi:MAG TPA: hypothetical protein IAC25_02315 [Candidatus Enterenecus stercoripullorum]|nr:hypothetical protein [Candidatus Enterenecus stercoripullorum]
MRTSEISKQVNILLLEAGRHEKLAAISREDVIAKGHRETARALRLAAQFIKLQVKLIPISKGLALKKYKIF